MKRILIVLSLFSLESFATAQNPMLTVFSNQELKEQFTGFFDEVLRQVSCTRFLYNSTRPETISMQF